MHEHDNEGNQADPETPNPGGAAPENRQCRYTLSDGRRCRNWALHGRDQCFRHDRFLHTLPERPI